MKTNILGLLVTLVVGVILAGSLLAPVISDAQKSVGDPITKSNQVYQGFYNEPDSDYELTLSAAGWFVNGDPLTGQNYRQLIFADTFVLQVNDPANETSFGYIMDKTMTNPTQLFVADSASYSVTFANNTVTVAKAGVTEPIYTQTYGWAYAAYPAATEGAWGTIVRIGTTDAYILNDNQIMLSGYYYTGENDTFYCYRDGTLYTGEYEGSVDITKSITDGTYDIYSVTGLSVHVGEESFTPYLTLVPIEVTGHATGGAAHSLVGVIPIMVIVALLISAVGAIALRRAD